MDFASNAASAKFGFALGWQALNAKADGETWVCRATSLSRFDRKGTRCLDGQSTAMMEPVLPGNR